VQRKLESFARMQSHCDETKYYSCGESTTDSVDSEAAMHTVGRRNTTIGFTPPNFVVTEVVKSKRFSLPNLNPIIYEDRSQLLEPQTQFEFNESLNHNDDVECELHKYSLFKSVVIIMCKFCIIIICAGFVWIPYLNLMGTAVCKTHLLLMSTNTFDSSLLAGREPR
jgi:hypothetical protein